MSPTSISGGGNLLTCGELISPASLKGQEEVLPSAKLEQWPYNNSVAQTSLDSRNWREVCDMTLRDFVLSIMASVAAAYLVKCLDVICTLIFG